MSQGQSGTLFNSDLPNPLQDVHFPAKISQVAQTGEQESHVNGMFWELIKNPLSKSQKEHISDAVPLSYQPFSVSQEQSTLFLPVSTVFSSTTTSVLQDKQLLALVLQVLHYNEH